MKKLYVIILVFYSVIVVSQNPINPEIALLEKKLTIAKTDSLKVNLLNKMSSICSQTNPDQGIVFAKKALALSQKIEWQNGIATSAMMVGTNFSAKSDFTNALLFFEKALQNNPKNSLKASVYKNIGLCYSYQNNYPKALEYGTAALTLYENLNDKTGMAISLSNIGIVYCDWEKYDKAIAFYNKALEMNLSIKNDEGLSYNYGNLGNVYSLLKNDQKAIAYYSKSLAISEKTNNLIGKAINLGSISSSYLNLKQFDKSLKNVEAALAIAKKMGIDGIIGFLTSIKADIFFQKGKAENNQNYLNQSVADFKIALEIHKKINSQKEISSDLDYLSKVYDYKKDYKNAFETYKSSVIYKDSIFNAENKETIKNIEDKRTIALREKEIKINELRKEKQQSYFVSGIVLLLFIGFFLIFQNQNRKKNNIKLQKLVVDLDQANKTKARFFGILNHDLRSPVSSLIHFLHLQKQNPELLTHEIKQQIENETILSAENLLSSMEDILQWSKSQMDNFSPKPQQIAVDKIFIETANHFSYEKSIVIQFENKENIILTTDENYLKTIIRNLTGNAIKALSTAQNPTIIWKAWQELDRPGGNSHKYLSISDNGQGAASNEFKVLYDDNNVSGINSGLGFHLIRDLAKAIDCEISVDSKIGVGTTFLLKFK